MGEFTRHGPCEKCPSSDGVGWYADGTGYCFVCGRYYRAPGVPGPILPVRPPGPFLEGTTRPLPARSLTEKTCQKFGVTANTDDGGQVIEPYYADGQLIAQHVRRIRPRDDQSRFFWMGDHKKAGFFGQHLWRDGGKKLVVTEGAYDAMSVAQVQGLNWPVVSLNGGAQGAAKEFKRQLQWLEKWDTVVIMFDMDEPGQTAAVECAQLLTPGRAKIAVLPMKDANEMLVAGEVKALTNAVWEAKVYRPKSIISGPELIAEALKPPPPSTPLPWKGLDTMLKGMRPREITTWCGGPGTGKSSLVAEIARMLLNQGAKVGIITLEEAASQAALRQVSLAMDLRLHDPEVRASVPNADLQAVADKALEGAWFNNTGYGSVDQESLMAMIRYLVVGLGCRWIILDHVSMMVSGSATDQERARLDELMTAFGTQVAELGYALNIVAHLRKAHGTPFTEGGKITQEDIRSSAGIAQFSHNIVAAERNQQDEDPERKNTTLLRVLKGRLGC